jgi:signal transduction histidine kinase/DNA-binding response OmpR family regulator/ligand-binding sensor domain-containing protein
VIYVGSSTAVLEYDGATWRSIELPNQSTVRALAMDADGRIYVGATGELGYLAPDAQHEMHYVSLLDKLPADSRVFEDVWRVYATPEGVYFQTQTSLFRWAGGTMRVWKPTARFNRASFVNGRLYLAEAGGPMMVMDGDRLDPLPGTERFGTEVYPVLLPWDSTRILMGTRADGLFLYDGRTLTPFRTEADPLITHAGLYRGFILPDDTIALTTILGGVAIIDRQGHERQTLNKQAGLRDDTVYYAMADQDGGLWLALGNGLSRVETPSPASFFTDADGLGGLSDDELRHDGRLYIATGVGTYYLDPARGPSGFPRIRPVTGVSGQCWALAEAPLGGGTRALLLAASAGVFEIRGETAVPIVQQPGLGFNASTVYPSVTHPDRVWVGLFDGLASIRRSGDRWVYEGRVADVPDQVRSLVELPDGTLWVGTATNGLLRLRFDYGASPVERPAHPALTRFGTANGLPAGGIAAYEVAHHAYFTGYKTPVLQYDDRLQRFVKSPTFSRLDPELAQAIGVREAPNGDVWLMGSNSQIAVVERQSDGTYQLQHTGANRFYQGGGWMYPEADGVIWFQTLDGFFRYDTKAERPDRSGLAALIRRVTVNQKTELFGGAGSAGEPQLDPASRALRFEYAAPSYSAGSGVEYRSRLDGLDTDWSKWTAETQRDYTNLPFGTYRFRLEARDARGRVSPETTYAFVVLPPWYRTWWAYAMYLVLAVFAAAAVSRVQRRRVVARERQRAEIEHAQLRAESAEAVAKSERDGKKNVELLSAIGREITASLDFDTIFDRLYEHVRELADADVFGVGLYHPDVKQIEYRLAIENGQRYTPYTRDASNPDQFPVWCLEHRQPVFINDVDKEWPRYLKRHDDERRPLADGSMSRTPQSLIYLPLVAKDRPLGIITIQSFRTHAYSEHHLTMMQSLASYTSVALDNASAYRQLNEQEHEIRRLFEEAQRARSAAEEADAAKSAFLSTVSHELRTPLTSVLGFAKIIKKRLEDRIFPLVQTDDRRIRQTMQQVEENLKVVVSEGERLTKLIDDVLDLAKIEAGKLEWHMESVDIADVIEHATAATASLFEQKGLALVKDVDPGLPAVTGDRDRLIQVVINLISNAVKFTERGSVVCRAVHRDGTLLVSVVDTGLGIAPADQPKVFERFKQVGDTLTDKPKGTGLGLPICREIVEHHGGRIWVESEAGRGSTFTFALPAAGAPAADSGPVELTALIRQLRDQVAVATPRTLERQPRILVVDDDANIRELLTQEFTDAGYEVMTAGNGRDAIADARQSRPDLIVLDVMMPEMNGFDAAAILKNDPQTADIPILILSIIEDKERGYRLGVDRYLTKPIDTDLLFREVGALLEQKKSRKRVLVVDEDASTVRTLSEVLRARGYSVSEARGDSLFETARHVLPDIIMLSSDSSARREAVRTLRFEKGLEHVLFFVYQ